MRRICHLLLLASWTCLLGCVSAAPIRVINWNTYHLFDHQKHRAAAANWLAEQAPTIATFQEVLHVNEAEWQRLARTWGHAHAVMHKESGYPVGLSSTQPITVVERRTDGFHHGYLHARTHGFDVFVVHFWPGKIHEASHIAGLASALADDGHAVLVAGDFNAEIRHDEAYLQAHGHLGTVEDGERTFDYRITDAFLEAGFVDITNQHAPDENFTFGSPALIPRWRKDLAHVHTARRRIDFIFVDAKTAASVRHVDVVTDDTSVGLWSDHYPVCARLTARR